MDELKRPRLRPVDGTKPAPRPGISPAPLAPAAKPVFQYQKPQAKRRRLLHPGRKALLLIPALVAVIVLFFGIKVLFAANRIITRNNSGGAPALAGAVDPTKLKGEGDGRINILLLGIGGAGHDGGTLSDTMMIVSIDPRTKSVAMLSIPRDLWVSIPGHGKAKINAADSYGGPDLAKSVVASTFDIPIHYYIQLDFQGFRLAVDQVGGIDVTNPSLLSDPNYPCDSDNGLVCPYSLPAGQYHLNGTQALKFVRCREGTCGSNYGREDRQRQSLLALRQRALALSTLTNPTKISNLIDIMGGHLKTDLALSDLSKLASIMKDLNVGTAVTKGLQDYTVTGTAGGQSVVLPKTGNYASIQDFVHSIFIDSYIQQENAPIEVQNGTTQAGLATTVGTQLRDSYKYNVVSMTTADNQNYPATVIYDYSGGKAPYTVKYLETRFGVKAQKATAPAGDTATIRIILGASYHAPVSSN